MHRFSRWKVPLSEAQSVADVVRLMSDYLATIGPEAMEVMPEACRHALTVEDIPGAAVVLIREELHFSGNEIIGAMLHEIAHTYVAASHRIASIQSRGQPITQPSQ